VVYEAARDRFYAACDELEVAMSVYEEAHHRWARSGESADARESARVEALWAEVVRARSRHEHATAQLKGVAGTHGWLA
jgi:hypothetical protein